MMENYLRQHHSRTAKILQNLPTNLLEKESKSTEKKISSERVLFGRGRGRSQMNQSNSNGFSRRLGPSLPTTEKKFLFSHRLNSTDNLSSPPIENEQNRESKTSFVLRGYKTKSASPTFINYPYNEPFTNEQLCYLLGPGKKEIIEKDHCQILPFLSLNYCRVKTIEQGKSIEKQLYSLLPKRLDTKLVKTNDAFALLICSSAAENIFQQSKFFLFIQAFSCFLSVFFIRLDRDHYAMISEPYKTQCKFDMIKKKHLIK